MMFKQVLFNDLDSMLLSSLKLTRSNLVATTSRFVVAKSCARKADNNSYPVNVNIHPAVVAWGQSVCFIRSGALRRWIEFRLGTFIWCKNIENYNFDQRLECAATKRWSKYGTHITYFTFMPFLILICRFFFYLDTYNYQTTTTSEL